MRWVLLIVSLISVTSAAWAIIGVTPRFSEALKTLPKDQFVRVNAVLSDQLQLDDLLKLVVDKPRRQWRAITVPLMIEHANQTQARLRRDLTALEKAGEVRNINIIWLGNVINFEAKASTLQGFFERHSELRSIDLDPDIPIEHLIDVDMTTPPQVVSPTTQPSHPDELNTTDWGLDSIQCHEMWSHGYWGQGIVIANIDTGCDTTHSALRNKIWHNTDEIPANGVDDDHNGYIDDNYGWNFDEPPTGGNNLPVPAASHGTNTSGIMVACTATDTVGVAPRAKLMVLRNNAGGQSKYWLAQQYAVRNGADVISSSLSYKWPDQPDYAVFRQNTDMELAAGVIHANSIGNQGTDLTNYPIPYNISTPGNCPPPWLWAPQTLRGGISSVMGCGAYQQTNQMASYTGRGPAAWDSIPNRPPIPLQYRDYPYRGGTMQALLKPDISMPTDSRTTTTGNGYITGFNGTSAATPHLGGAMALLLSAIPDATPREICEALKMSADTTGTNRQYNLCGAGRAKIWNAYQYLSRISGGGSIRGTVIDTLTSRPVNRAAIAIYTALERDTVTDSAGHFFFPRASVGVCSMSVSAPGYIMQMLRNVRVDSAETTNVTIYLRSPRIRMTPDTLSFSLRQGDTTRTSVYLSNTGSGLLQWTLSTARIGGTDTVWQPLLQVPVSSLTRDGRINGIEYAWGKIWVTGDNNLNNPNYIYRFNRSGALLDSIRQPHPAYDFGFRDLAFDGQYLWGSDSQYLYALDSNGVIRDSVITPLNPSRGVAIDPTTHNFYVGDLISPIQVISRTGQVLRLLTHNLHIYGLAWNSSDPDSMQLYILSADSTPGCLLSKMNPVTGARRPLRIMASTTNRVAGGLAFADDWSYENRALLMVEKNSSSDTAAVRVINMGFMTRWLSLPRTMGSLWEGLTDTIPVQLSAIGAPVGTRSALLQARGNTPQTSVGTIIQFRVDPSNSIPEQPVISLPSTFKVSELYPNPFNPTTSLTISLPAFSPLTITVYDRLGREATRIHRDRLAAGTYHFEIGGNRLASGLYFVFVRTNFGSSVKKGIFLK